MIPSVLAYVTKRVQKQIATATRKGSKSTVLQIIPADHCYRGNGVDGSDLTCAASFESWWKPLVAGRYKIGSDDALTLTTEYETTWYEERLWFASPNLRMRVSVVKRIGGFSTASFTSEIRMGGSQPTAKTSQATHSASS